MGFVALTGAGAGMACAQAVSVDHMTRSEILERAQALDASSGSASVKLKDYEKHYTMVAMRHRDGGAELHENFADIFFVAQGKATLLSGGALQDAKAAGPGEVRGTALKGGTKAELKEGDVIHIPAGVPHQMLVAEGESFVYFVVKVKER